MSNKGICRTTPATPGLLKRVQIIKISISCFTCYQCHSPRPRPKTKLPTCVEIVPDMYPNLPFCDMSCKPSKIREKVIHQPAFFKDSIIILSREWQRVT